MRRYFRAYPAISSRQQGADRLVYNETDLRTVLWQAVDPAFEGERPSTIRLAADIYLTKPIELGPLRRAARLLAATCSVYRMAVLAI
jgi:hypothetical protein